MIGKETTVAKYCIIRLAKGQGREIVADCDTIEEAEFLRDESAHNDRSAVYIISRIYDEKDVA